MQQWSDSHLLMLTDNIPDKGISMKIPPGKSVEEIHCKKKLRVQLIENSVRNGELLKIKKKILEERLNGKEPGQDHSWHMEQIIKDYDVGVLKGKA